MAQSVKNLSAMQETQVWAIQFNSSIFSVGSVIKYNAHVHTHILIFFLLLQGNLVLPLRLKQIRQ